jgi:hypothetical protein
LDAELLNEKMSNKVAGETGWRGEYGERIERMHDK